MPNVENNQWYWPSGPGDSDGEMIVEAYGPGATSYDSTSGNNYATANTNPGYWHKFVYDTVTCQQAAAEHTLANGAIQKMVKKAC